MEVLKMKKMLFLMIILAVLLSSSILALTEQTANGEDVQLRNGLDLEQLLNFGSGILALVLFALTVTAYKRSKNNRLIFVSVAFLLFAVNGILISSQLLFGDWAWIDPIVSIINFAILVCFFFGILKK
jgi:Co/Zn/Cd efflux system component